MNGRITLRGRGEFNYPDVEDWDKQFFTLVTFHRRTFRLTAPLPSLSQVLDITRWNTTPAEIIVILSPSGNRVRLIHEENLCFHTDQILLNRQRVNQGSGVRT